MLARLVDTMSRALLRLVLAPRDRGPTLDALDDAARRRASHGEENSWRGARDALRAVPIAIEVRLAGRRPRVDNASEIVQAARRIRRRPATTLIASLILAVGTVTGTAAFGLFDVLERMHSGLDATGLHVVRITSPRSPFPARFHDPALYRSARDAGLLVAASAHSEAIVRVDGATTTEWGVQVSPEYFELVGVPLQVGRPPDPAAAQPEAAIAHSFWRSHFGGDPAVVGRVVAIGGEDHRIVGILSAGVRGFRGSAAVWRVFDRQGAPRRVRLLARIPANTGAETERVRAQIAAAVSERDRGTELAVELLPVDDLSLTTLDRLAAGDRTAGLVILMALLLALATTANAANVILADHLARSREFAVRRALGAGRGRMLALVASEATIRAALVMVITLVGSQAALLASQAWNPTPVVPGFDRPPALPGETVMFAVLLAGGTCFLASLVPATTLLRRLRHRSDAGRTGNGLVVVQVGIATALVIAAAAVSLAVMRIHGQPLGYEESGRYAFRVNLSAVPEHEGARGAATERLTRALQDHPQIRHVGIADSIPAFLRDNFLLSEGDDTLRVAWMGVGADYLDAVGLELVHGRRPHPAAADEVMLSRAAAEGLGIPAGTTGAVVRLERDEADRVVVGIVEDGTYTAPDIVPMMISPTSARNASILLFIVDTSASLPELRDTFRELSAEIHPQLPAAEPIALAEWFQRAWYLSYTGAALARVLAVVSLVISALGLYATFARLVRARTPELGIRLALGATPATVFTRVMRTGLAVCGVGIVCGAGIAYYSASALQSLVNMSSRPEPLIYFAGGALVAAIASAAMLLPALRAATVDPAISLRED